MPGSLQDFFKIHTFMQDVTKDGFLSWDLVCSLGRSPCLGQLTSQTLPPSLCACLALFLGVGGDPATNDVSLQGTHFPHRCL